MLNRAQGAALARRSAAIAAIVAAAAGGGVIVATPAVAAGANCANGYHCVFFTDVNSSKHSYFNSDTNFANDTFSGGDGRGSGQVVNNNTWAASNSSTGGYESHYYDGTNYAGAFLFCVNPGETVHVLPDHLKDRASSLRLRGQTSIRCLSN